VKELSTYEEATQFKEWVEAMVEEHLKALKQNET